jgi:LemA protein
MSGGTTTAVVGGIVCALLIVLAAALVATYNRLIRLRNQADASWAQIDVQLKRRYELIPNLVETVKGYATHERGTLEAVVTARGNAIAAAGAPGPAGRAEAEGALTAALGRLFAVAEAYPDLRASPSFVTLQVELATTEDKIAYARQFFNSAIQSYNTAVQSLPTNVVALLTGFRTRDFYRAGSDERGPVQVRF